MQPNVGRLGLYEIEGRLIVSSLGRQTIVARNVCYVDVRAEWRVSRAVSGIRADTVSDVQPQVDRYGLWRVSRGTSLLARIKGPGRRYTGVCVELTTGSPLYFTWVSRCRSAHPATVICITVVVLRGGGVLLLH
jgi:hypothetical protein